MTYNPISNYEEYLEVEGLTLWDLNRPVCSKIIPPQPSTTTTTFPSPTSTTSTTPTTAITKINSRTLKEFKCPICMNMLRETCTVMECMHRFCSECIQRCLRSSKQECPSCRAHVPSRRSLRRDYQFDALINTVFPNLDKHERLEDKQQKKYTLIKASQVSETLQMRIYQQNENRKNFVKIRAPTKKEKEKQEKEEKKKLKKKKKKKKKHKKKRKHKKKKKKRRYEKNEESESSDFSSDDDDDDDDDDDSDSDSPGASVVPTEEDLNQKKRKRNHHNRTSAGSVGQGTSTRPRPRRTRPRNVAPIPYSPTEARFLLASDPSSTNTPHLPYPWLNTLNSIQVQHIKKYLQRKLGTNGGANTFQIFINVKGTKIILTALSRLSDIQAIWPSDTCITLFYAYVRVGDVA